MIMMIGVSYLASVLEKLLPLRLELFSSDHVHFPVLVVVGDEKSSFGKVRQNRLDDDNRSSSVKLLVYLGLNQSINQSINRSIDQSINRCLYVESDNRTRYASVH